MAVFYKFFHFKVQLRVKRVILPKYL